MCERFLRLPTGNLDIIIHAIESERSPGYAVGPGCAVNGAIVTVSAAVIYDVAGTFIHMPFGNRPTSFILYQPVLRHYIQI